ncbi:pectate lyase [Aureococcus anophagefferens]|nr:pectate lyase [Aureococcus anophagefferens]
MGRVPFFLVVVAAARADDAPRCADDPFWIAADAGAAGAPAAGPGPKADPIAGCAVSESEARARYYPREWGTDDVVDVTLHRDGAVSTANPYGAVGFAAWATAGVVYGGSDGAEVDAYTAADLAAFLESDDALVIHVRADFAMPQVVLYDRSDKTVEGHRHTLRWSDDTDSKSMFVFWDCWNIVFRELRLEQGEADSPGADVFYLRGGHHFLFDKLTFDYEGCNTETCDESMHFQSPVTFVTVQRCLFDTYKQNMNIKHGSRLGNYGYDDKSARITFYENLFLNGNSREPKIDVGWVHLVNTLWIDEDAHSYYGIRAIAEGDVLPEVLVEGAYVENFDKIYYHEEGGLIAEDFCNVDEFSRDRASTPRAKADLSWCAPYDYYRMDPFDCHEIARVRANAGAVVGTTGAPSASPAPSAAPSRAPRRRRRAARRRRRRRRRRRPRPASARPSAAPTAPPDAAVRVGGSARAIHAGRMGLYVSAGEECGGRPFYDCADCPSHSALYYDDGLGYWFVGPNGCGSHTVAMYAVDGARSPDRVAVAWREWDGAGWAASDGP